MSRSPLFVLLLLAVPLTAGEPAREVVRPADTGAALANPGMGWVFHHFDNSVRGYGPPLGPAYAGEGFPGLTVAYLRLAWSYLEPEDGVFDWSRVDTVAQRYIRAGRAVAFRFTCFESGDLYATPKWLKEAGVGGRWFRYGKGIVEAEEPGATWEPDYDDPLFLSRLDRFLAAAARRYDGNPNVAFIDIGSIGIWGEGNPCTRSYPLALYKTHIDLHFKHFRKTLLVGMDDWRPTPEFRQPGTVTSAFTVRADEDLRGRDLLVRVGLWLPHDAGRTLPEGRLLPAWGLADRRVDLGTLHVAADGAMTFESRPRPPETGDPGDFAVAVREFTRRPERGALTLDWTLRRELPPGVRPFCHVGDAEKDIRQNCAVGSGRNEALDYARQLGGTMRDDSIIYRKGVRFSSDHLAADFWPTRPVVLESGHYAANDWSEGADQDYFDALEAYHGSYISIHGPPDLIWREHADIIGRMNLRLGYRLQLLEASWPREVTAGQPFEIASIWRNAGVAPCHPGGHPAFTLKDAAGAIHGVLAEPEFDVRALAVGAPGKAPGKAVTSRFRLPETTATRSYDIFVSVGDLDGTPRLELPLANGDGERRYRLGALTCRVDGEYRLRWEAPVQVDGRWRLPVVFDVLKPLPERVVPFGHLDREARIVKGLGCHLPEGAEALRRVGSQAGYYVLEPPDGTAGGTLTLHLGLWVLHGRRILPENGAEDLRVPVGTVSFQADGTPVVTRAPPGP